MDDLILRVIADLSDLRYADAIVRGREVMAYARPMMSPAQASLLHTVIAAAFDSAIKELEAAIRVKPDVVLPVELAWDGLDSLRASWAQPPPPCSRAAPNLRWRRS